MRFTLFSKLFSAKKTYQLPQHSEKSQYVQAKFDEIAYCYDRFNDWVTQGQHRLWKRALIRKMNLQPEYKVLDLCCGTADLSQRALPALSQAGSVIALDFSTQMTTLASARLSTAKHTNAYVVRGNALHLPFSNQQFDAVMIGYGLRNLIDLPAGLLEIARVLKPSGVLGCLDMGKPKAWIAPFANFYLFRIAPMIGHFIQPQQDMFSYLPASTQNYPSAEALRELLLSHQFAQVQVRSYLFGITAIHVAKKVAPH